MGARTDAWETRDLLRSLGRLGLSRDLLKDALDIARELCYHRNVDAKAVALDGTIIHKGGNMTGGESPGERKRRFDDSEVENLAALIEKFRGEIQNLTPDYKRQVEVEVARRRLFLS